LSDKGRHFPNFELRLGHRAFDLIEENGRIAGVLVRGPQNETISVHADLVVGCDGRHSVTRQAGGLAVREFGVPIDVLWFRISRRECDPEEVLGTLNYGKALILINRGDYFQAGLIIRKGSFDEIKNSGLAAFRASLLQIAPFLSERVQELQDWEQVKLLTVQINRLPQWYRDGLLCIGDAAHAMSPAGGVGINLAIQDAVASANLLTDALLRGRPSETELARVQNRREFPARLTQAAQVQIHKNFERVFATQGPLQAPWQLKLIVQIPGIHRALGYAVGMGVRPEHVERNPVRQHPPTFRFLRGIAAGIAAAVSTYRRLTMQSG
jgi:2-polyprenyl-6-methoxyphenol hydroxylase-like FAD-dependent oxidoreductase